MNRLFRTLLISTLLFNDSFVAAAQQPVEIRGAMRNVMRKGQLGSTIHLDTISNKSHLFGLGPVEYLRGELLILDGKSYISRVSGDSMVVEESFQVSAPFFVYSNVDSWKTITLPDSILNMKQLEQHLDGLTQHINSPFAFRLQGKVAQAKIHVVNLPEGSKVSSPEEAHRGQQNYHLSNEEVEIIGFFSKEHQSVFTHHDTWMHMHLITNDRTQMGHLDEVTFAPGSVRLFLPARMR